MALTKLTFSICSAQSMVILEWNFLSDKLSEAYSLVYKLDLFIDSRGGVQNFFQDTAFVCISHLGHVYAYASHNMPCLEYRCCDAYYAIGIMVYFISGNPYRCQSVDQFSLRIVGIIDFRPFFL